MGKASPPDPPDYKGAAEATAESSQEMANQQLYYNRPDQVTPFGSQKWTYGSQTDPVTGKPYTTTTQTSTLAPDAQDALSSQLRVQSARSGFAEDMIGRVEEGYQDPMDFSQFGEYQGIEPGTPVDPSYQTGRQAFQAQDPNALRQQELGRMREYAEPNIAQQRGRMETQLANQGITQGSEAYENAMRQQEDQLSRQDLGFQMAAGGEAQRAQAMGSEAQRQMATEQQRDIMGQQFGMGEQQRGGYQQQQDIQKANYANNLRQMQLAEAMQQRGYGLNEMNALLTGQQVQMPQMPGFQGASKGQAADYLGASQMQGQHELDIFNTQQASKDALMSGVMNMGSSAMMCDIRVKRNLEHIGFYEDGIPQYAFQYVWSDEWFVGPVAQEVEKVRPDLVGEIDGLKFVRIGGLH